MQAENNPDDVRHPNPCKNQLRQVRTMTNNELEHKRAKDPGGASDSRSNAEVNQAEAAGKDDADDAIRAVIHSRDDNPKQC